MTETLGGSSLLNPAVLPTPGRVNTAISSGGVNPANPTKSIDFTYKHRYAYKMDNPGNLPATTERVRDEDKPDRYYHYTDDQGRIHKVDILSGKIVESSPRFEDSLVEGKFLHPSFIKGNHSFWQYSDVYRDLISDRIAKGQSMAAISKTQGFPSTAIIAKWRLQNPEFDEAIRAAYRVRAEHFRDTIADTLAEDSLLMKDEVPAAKLMYDKRKWLAEKDDPDKYGTRVKHAGDEQAPMVIRVDTGIRRETLPSTKADDVIEVTDYKENINEPT